MVLRAKGTAQNRRIRPEMRTRGTLVGLVVLTLLALLAGGHGHAQGPDLPEVFEAVDLTPATTRPDLAVSDITAMVQTGDLDAFQAEQLRAGSGSTSFLTAVGGSSSDRATSVIQTSDGDYIVAGATSSYGTGDEELFLLKFGADGALDWARTAGGPLEDRASAVAQTTDLGYVVAGYTESYGTGASDVFVLKYNSAGTLIWAKAVGGSSWEEARSVHPTADGGFVLAGYTSSSGAGDADVLLLKFASNGTLSWSRTAGGSAGDVGQSVHTATNGGYIVAGYTYSYGAGSSDVFLLKFHAEGILLWARTAGGSELDTAESLTPVVGGGYVVAGSSFSYGEGASDAFLLKYDESGNLVWARTAGGSSLDYAYSVDATASGGFVVAGSTMSYAREPFQVDALLLWYDAAGELVQARAIGGSGGDSMDSVVQTKDGGCLFAGWSSSFGTHNSYPTKPDVMLLRTDADGLVPDCDACRALQPATRQPAPLVSAPVVLATGPTDFTAEEITPDTSSPSPTIVLPCGRLFLVTAGGGDLDGATETQPTRDGGYIVAGYTDNYGAGERDIFLLKYDGVGRLSWARTAGAAGNDLANGIAQTSDGGYIVAGNTGSFGGGLEDILLLKFDAGGALSWARTAAGADEDLAYSVAQTSDEGYIVTGYTWSYGAGGYDVLLLKYDSEGTLLWARTAGGNRNDQAYSVAQTSDDGYIVAGSTNSYGTSSSALLIKYDIGGALTWMLAIGGSNSESARSVQQTRDGGYVFAGSTSSYGAGLSDLFLVKLDAGGWLSWAKVAGGGQPDSAHSVSQTADGGYIVAGETLSYGAGGKDAILLKYDSDGALSWARTVGGGADDIAFSVRQSMDRGYILAGTTRSLGSGQADVLVTKADTVGELPDCDLCQPASPATYTPSSLGVSSYTMTKNSPTFSTGAPALSSGPASPGSEWLCSSVRQIFLPLVRRR